MCKAWVCAGLLTLSAIVGSCSDKGAQADADESSGGAISLGGSSSEKNAAGGSTDGGAGAGDTGTGGADAAASDMLAGGALTRWSGEIRDGTDAIKVGFQLKSDGHGNLTGNQILFDPTTGRAFAAGSVTGHTEKGVATWSSQSGVAVSSSFEGEALKGTITFPSTSGFPKRTAAILLGYTGDVQ